MPPISYLWSPSTGLTNPSNVYTWAKPDTTTFYNLSAIDSAGCQGGDGFRVYVNPVGIENENIETMNISVFPIPLTKGSKFKFENKKMKEIKLNIYDALGHLIFTNSTFGDEFKIQRNLSSGIYFYVLMNQQNILKKGKLIAE